MAPTINTTKTKAPQPDVVELTSVKRSLRPPFKVLFNNDCTNIEDCVSPFQPEEKLPFAPEKLYGSIDETAGAGIDVHMLSPGMGWVPWWNSKYYPVKEHYDWWRKTYNGRIDGYGEYMCAGGDITRDFVQRCRQKTLTPFITFRMNDAHHRNWADIPAGTLEAPPYTGHSLCRFYRDHPEYRIAPDLKMDPDVFEWDYYYKGVHNWALPEVRKHKLKFIEELCQYDIDGFELDFLRFYSFFDLEATTADERAQIMTGFVKQTRKILDQTAQPNQRRWLCVRIPCYTCAFDMLGIDLEAFAEAGVDMFNLSAHYFTDQPLELSQIRRLVPDAAVYMEMAHTTSVGKDTNNNNVVTYRRTTPQQYYTTAHLAYARGLDGVAAFNFVYYRQHGWPDGGPFHEPPFGIFEHLADKSFLARQPQHYFIGHFYDQPVLDFHHQVPCDMDAGQSAQFRIDMAPPAGGWRKAGRLRIQTARPMKDCRFDAYVKEHKLRPSDDIGEPYENPYPQLLGSQDTLLAWTVPSELPADGTNEFRIDLATGTKQQIIFVDLAMQ